MYRLAGSKVLHKVRENSARIITLMSLSYYSFIGVPGLSNPIVKTALFSTGIGMTLLFALNIEKEKGTAIDMLTAIKDRGIDREQFARDMGLSYLNDYWDEGVVGGEESAIVQVFSDRFKEKWERFEIDFSGYRASAHKLKRKWDNLQTEHRIARDIWDAQFLTDDHEKNKDVTIPQPITQQLRDIAQIVEAVLQDVLSQGGGEYSVNGMDFEEFQKYYAHMLKQENVQLNDFVKKQEAKTTDQISEAEKEMVKVAKSRLRDIKDQQKIDKEARVLYSYLWLKTMDKRFSFIIYNIYSNKPLPGNAAQQKMIRYVTQKRKLATYK